MCLNREMLSVSPPSRQMIWSSKLKPWQILLECIDNDLVYNLIVTCKLYLTTEKALENYEFSKAFYFRIFSIFLYYTWCCTAFCSAALVSRFCFNHRA